MRAYCERMQREGLLEVQQLNARNGGVPADAYRVASGRCITDWPDDFSMQAYCLRQQLEGYAAVSRGPSSPLVNVTAQEAAVIGLVKLFVYRSWVTSQRWGLIRSG